MSSEAKVAGHYTREEGQPALALHLLMGNLAPLMLKNVLIMMKQGVLAPVEFYARAV